ncbi:hypothetical protein A1O3_00300 [Capronia epimyces CBS 606.96]|uniref:Tyrosinase copper-binding domain-containing protein n=1 Tax=Capronia epimyces CBS 606.96 TaxID=1182542 RepID=W9YQ03_9EURO|nr:uncharacterized protein A1O3_00300 [Capronia epimyces CBS 606.96]EXJ91750.1 hypothetical protein A1O3_00300 [Capronia epimyces CBS 606.96]
MVNAIVSLAALALSALPALIEAAPAPGLGPAPWGPSFFGSPGKYPPCTEDRIKIRKDFDSMAPAERKAFTDAINCMMTKPSQLDQTLYPAATNRYMDYAVTHVNLTQQVHLSGFFLTWHRYYGHLFEQDLAEQCGYTGAFPYWNWPATADNLRGSAVFDGSEYSMSGDGIYVDDGPVVLSPFLQLPHGSGGGCVNTGPFAGLQTTMAPISIDNLIAGLPLPDTAFQLNQTCLTRDLNTYAAQRYCNYTALYEALDTDDLLTFDQLINGVIGGAELGLHSGAHFIVGSPASSIFVSVQDPIWWPLHAMLDNLYTSWQLRHPDLATAVYGTETANNAPPSANVTLDTPHPGWGYFDPNHYTIRDLISTTSGPFCYKYDVAL